MLEPGRIASIIAKDKYCRKKKLAREGQKYYDGEHDILDYRIYYINKEGHLVEDLTKSNIRIPHPFFHEISEQEVSYILSGGVSFETEDEELGRLLGSCFGDDFTGELKEVLIDAVVRGSGYIYWYQDAGGHTRFQHADSLGIVEVKDGGPEDTVNDYILRYYPVEIKDGKTAVRIEVWDKNMTWYYLQSGSTVELDKNIKINPCPHVLYQGPDGLYYKEGSRIPFLKLSYNRKECSRLKQIKPIIDDYDLMNCGLSNNLQDITEGIYVVKGFKGQDYDELLANVKARKVVGVGDKGDLDIKTINIPYEARLAKIQEDEKNIYRTALAFNSSQTGDGNITNIILKSRYTLLDMKAKKFIWSLKKFLGTLLEVVLEEINEACGTRYEKADVKISIEPVVPTDEKEDAEIRKIEAETAREKVGALMDAAELLGEDILLKELGGILELEEELVKQRIEEQPDTELVKGALNGEETAGSTTGAIQ